VLEEDDPYAVFKREEMILRDWLALDRTVLANKRTFLAYARTSIALIVLGIAFVRLIDHRFFEIAGFCLMAVGMVIFVVGTREYTSTANRLRKLLRKEKELEKELLGKELYSEKEA
jgi:putative membrane protein